ncbi:MAG: hypothetical protein H0V09_11475, partial [Gemmatimonadetes bacterium]|nr:hypothetical protein [Gemmatimonadota bacterium]
MRRTAPLLAVLLLVAAACVTHQSAPPPPPRPDLRYYVKRAQDPALLQVTLVAENIGADSIDFAFPVWLPGDFRPIEPGRWAEDVRAYDRSTVELPVRRLGSNAWRIHPRRAPYFLVSYVLHPVRPDGYKRSLISELTATGGYFTGAVAFGHFKGLETHPASLSFELGSGWPALCSLDSPEPGRYQARDAHELAQSGCAYGPRVRQLETSVRGVSHRVALVAPASFREDSLLAVVRDVAGAQSAAFRSPPYRAYTFFIHLVEPGTSGLGASSLAGGSAYYLPEIRPDRIRASGIPQLLAHQLFHAWNLGVFPPAELHRPALDRPVADRGLWLVEGLADHYARLALARGRVLPRSEIYAGIARDLQALAARPGAARANLETVSLQSTRTLERDAAVPLALKSGLAALALDIELRRASANGLGADSLLGWLAGGGS